MKTLPKMKEVEFSIPDQYLGTVLLLLIKVLGYQLLANWSDGTPQYILLKK